MDTLADTDIETGKFKYILIQVKQGDQERYLVRGKSLPFHADILEDVEEKELEPLKKTHKIKWNCVGGGRILHKPDLKSIKVFGYSQGFGQAKHEIATELLKKHYPDYSKIEWSNEGY